MHTTVEWPNTWPSHNALFFVLLQPQMSVLQHLHSSLPLPGDSYSSLEVKTSHLDAQRGTFQKKGVRPILTYLELLLRVCFLFYDFYLSKLQLFQRVWPWLYIVHKKEVCLMRNMVLCTLIAVLHTTDILSRDVWYAKSGASDTNRTQLVLVVAVAMTVIGARLLLFYF